MAINKGRRDAVAQLVSLSGAAALGVPSLAFAQPAKPASIVVNAAGGAVNKALREAFFSEFEKRYGIKVIDTSPTDFGKLRAMVQSGNVEWSVMEINEADAERGQSLLAAVGSGRGDDGAAVGDQRLDQRSTEMDEIPRGVRHEENGRGNGRDHGVPFPVVAPLTRNFLCDCEMTQRVLGKNVTSVKVSQNVHLRRLGAA